jgi:hypothetical protein
MFCDDCGVTLAQHSARLIPDEELWELQARFAKATDHQQAESVLIVMLSRAAFARPGAIARFLGTSHNRVEAVLTSYREGGVAGVLKTL